MPERPGWIWKAYFLFYLLLSAVSLILFFADAAPLQTYYRILIAFNIFNLLFYILDALAVILNAFSLLPLYLYTFQLDFLSPGFWRWFTIIRFGLDITSHFYGANFLKSVYHNQIDISILGISVPVFWLVITVLLSFHLPCYIALYRYAFREEKGDRLLFGLKKKS